MPLTFPRGPGGRRRVGRPLGRRRVPGLRSRSSSPSDPGFPGRNVSSCLGARGWPGAPEWGLGGRGAASPRPGSSVAGVCEHRTGERLVLRAAGFRWSIYHCCSRSAFLTLLLLAQYLVILASTEDSLLIRGSLVILGNIYCVYSGGAFSTECESRILLLT